MVNVGVGRLDFMHTQIGIIGAGPAGMFLALLLRSLDIDCVVLEARDRAYAQGRVRAGVLEQHTVDLMHELGVGARLARDGLAHHGTKIAVNGEVFRIDFAALTGGRAVTVYGQQEVMRDLYDAAQARGIEVLWDAPAVSLDVASDTPSINYRSSAGERRLRCDFIIGCDGFHGRSRQAVPNGALTTFERVHDFGWLGILADVPPADPELIYAHHERGFALASMRSATRSRYYLQCSQHEDLQLWPDERIWDELCLRLGPAIESRVTRGTSIEKSVTPVRSFVVEPMRWGKLFLAGDAAHIVPPAGAKGVNLAVADVRMLAAAFAQHYRQGRAQGLDAYSSLALARVWKAERFSWWFTSLLHSSHATDGFTRRLQLAELDYIRHSRAAQQTLAENYVGLPFEVT